MCVYMVWCGRPQCSLRSASVVSSCTNISAKALVAAAGEKVRPMFALTFCTSTTRKLDWKHAAMGTQKKEANRKERQGKTGDGMGNVKTKGENFYRYALHFAHTGSSQRTNRTPDLQRRSRSSSASLMARLSATPRETSPSLPRTSHERRLSPVSSPTGSGSTTPVSSLRMRSSRSVPLCRRSRQTPRPTS
jgi:hypothetical protein